MPIGGADGSIFLLLDASVVPGSPTFFPLRGTSPLCEERKAEAMGVRAIAGGTTMCQPRLGSLNPEGGVGVGNGMIGVGVGVGYPAGISEIAAMAQGALAGPVSLGGTDMDHDIFTLGVAPDLVLPPPIANVVEPPRLIPELAKLSAHRRTCGGLGLEPVEFVEATVSTTKSLLPLMTLTFGGEPVPSSGDLKVPLLVAIGPRVCARKGIV